jgi:peptidyl-prolyl cis-trans isomerase A (cyclophilin A)
MRNLSLVVLLLAGCEHKKNAEPQRPPEGSNPWVTNASDAAGSATAEKPPTPTPPPSQSPAAAPPPVDKTVGDDEVRPPTADDLAKYTDGIKGSGQLIAKFETSMGTITCQLFPEKAPMTVANFVGLATGKKPWMNPKTGNVEKQKPFYDGLIFHRVIQEFMIQGGDPLGSGTGGPGYQFGDEVHTGLKMEPGTLAMANAGPSTNGSQFFITEIGPDWLNDKHTIFGKCKELDLVKKIARVPQNAQNKPDSPITMKVTISKGSW